MLSRLECCGDVVVVVVEERVVAFTMYVCSEDSYRYDIMIRASLNSLFLIPNAKIDTFLSYYSFSIF